MFIIPLSVFHTLFKNLARKIQDLLDELEASKQSPIAGLERFAKAPFGSFGVGKRCHPATGPEDI
jgi:hypothetical protein